jgi:hypothetical protein
MSEYEARPEVTVPEGMVYGEDRSGVRWPLVATIVVGWVLLIGGAIGAAMPHLVGLSVLALVGAFLVLVFTVGLPYSLAVGIRVYEDRIEIGGMRGRDRRLQKGKWPPRKLSVGAQPRAVFTAPWTATYHLHLITGRSEIKRFRREMRRKRKHANTTVPLGYLSTVATFANALLVISVDPSRTATDPPKLGIVRLEYSVADPVPSPTWMVPTRNPSALREALRRLPGAPAVHDQVSGSGIQFELG